jgi:hypothetical protein
VGGDDHGEAYTAIMRGVGVSHDNDKVVGAETFSSVEGNTCGADKRGAVALPGSRATSRMKGTRRNLGDLQFDRVAAATPVRIGKVRSRSRG